MKPLQTLAHCAREYPLLTMVGVYTALYTAGEFIARYVYDEPDYVFGDATALMLDSAEAGLLEFGNVSLVALRRLFGHDARDTAAFEHVIASFFRQAAVLLQRCLDRNIISVEEAEAAAEAGDDIGDRVRLGISAAVLLSAAVRSADDAALANKARIVLASGDAVVSNDSVPAALQEALAMVLEAKKQLASPHHRTAEDRVRLCRDLVRAAICVEINQCVGCTRQFFTKSFLGDDAADLAQSSGEEPASPRHRAGVASMAWRTTR